MLRPVRDLGLMGLDGSGGHGMPWPYEDL